MKPYETYAPVDKHARRHLGVPQTIIRDPLYGLHILTREWKLHMIETTGQCFLHSLAGGYPKMLKATSCWKM